MRNSTRNLFVAGNLIFALTMATSSLAGDVSGTNLEPLQAHTINLTNYTAVIYYTVLESGDYQLITTIGPNVGIVGLMAQHRVTIESGQSYEFSLDKGVTDTPANAIRFIADEDVLVVASR